ncbi:hypothetical protein GCM10009839_86720 [Catenulispora yoronensis]|uniref:Uncharacterized protein n=1 Tax=Catenulispora yoronensis TaxID=450799 RepID=A0ABP5H0Y9_9ACTN
MTKNSFGDYDADTQQADRDEQLKAPAHTAPLRKFALNPFNRVLPPGDVRDMAASLRRWGQVQPIRVVTRGAFEKRFRGRDYKPFKTSVDFVVIIGNKRLAGADLTKLDKLEYVVDNALVTDGRHPAEMILEENRRRTDLTCMDEARQVVELLPLHGDNLTRLAEHLGPGYGRSWVSTRKALHDKLPQIAKDAVDLRLIEFTQARSLITLALPEQLAQLAEWGVDVGGQKPEGTVTAETLVVTPTRSVTRVTAPRAPSEAFMVQKVRAFAGKHGPATAGRVLREQLDDDQAVQAVEAMVEGLNPAAFERLLDSLAQRHAATRASVPGQGTAP